MTLKLNTFDFTLTDPAVVPQLNDLVVCSDPAWTGNVSHVKKADLTNQIGHTLVVVTATNQFQAVAAPAPYALVEEGTGFVGLAMDAEPIAAWRLNDIGGLTAVELTGSGMDGAVKGQVQQGVIGGLASQDYAMAFDGFTGNVRITEDPRLEFGLTSFSVMCLVNPLNFASNASLVEKRGTGAAGTNKGWGVRLTSGSGQVAISCDDGSGASQAGTSFGAASAIPARSSSLIIITFDRVAALATCYVGGVQKGGQLALPPGDITNVAHDLILGMNPNSSFFLAGILSEVYLYPRVLDPAKEIPALAAAVASTSKGVGYQNLTVDESIDSNGNVKTLATCTIFQNGLQPGMTVQLNSINQGLSGDIELEDGTGGILLETGDELVTDGQEFTVQNVTAKWPGKPGDPVFTVEMGDPIVTMSVWAQGVNAGIFPIDSTKITDGAVTTPKLAANAVNAQAIAAGAITADKLAATLVLASLLQAGSGAAHVEIDENGLRAYDSNGNLIINLPDDGTAATINTNLIGQSLSVIGNAVFRGILNELGLGAVWQLDAQQNDPTQAPIVAATWDTVTLPVDATYDFSSTKYSRSCIFYDAAGGAGGATKTFWSATSKGDGSHEYMLELNASDRTVLRSIDLGVGGANGVNPLSVARLGSYVYMLSADKSAGSGGTANLGQTAGPSSGTYDGNLSGGTNQIMQGPFTMSEHGTIDHLSVNVSGQSGNITVTLVLWDGSGNVQRTVNITAATGTNNHTYTAAITGIDAPSGSKWYVGAFWAKTSLAYWGVNTTKADFTFKNGLNSVGTAPGTDCAGNFPSVGGLTAYAGYTKVTAVTTYVVRRYVQSSLALDTTYSSVVFPVTTPVAPLLTADGTNLYIVDRAASSTIQFASYDGSLNQLSSVDTGYNSGSNPTAAFAGTTDLPAWRLVLADSAALIDTFDNTGARQSSEQFSTQSSGASGITYGDALGDGARFWTMPPIVNVTAQVLTKHSQWLWASGGSSVWWAAYSWADTNAAGSGTHETGISPRASATLSQRQKLVITAQPIPGGGGVDDPNNINFYLTRNATDPGTPGHFVLQATQTAQTYTATSFAEDYLQLEDGSGPLMLEDGSGELLLESSVSDVSNSFPAGTPAKIAAQSGTFAIRGDSTFNLGKYHAHAHRAATWTATGGQNNVVPFDTVDEDPNGSFTTGAAAKYTCPVAGRYLVIATLFSLTNASPDNKVPYASLNGGLTYKLVGGSHYGSGGNYQNWDGGSAVVRANAGDYIQILYFTAGTFTTGALSPTDTWVEIMYLGD